MKNVFVVIMSAFFLGFVTFTNLPAGRQAFAETSVNIEGNGEGASSEVHIENSVGESTTCVNGSCTTTQNGGNSTTVCINGKCETSHDGTFEKNEGGAKVSVKQNSLKQQNVQGPSALTITSTATPTHSTSSGQAASNSAESSISAQKDEQPIQQLSLEKIITNIRDFFTELLSQK